MIFVHLVIFIKGFLQNEIQILRKVNHQNLIHLDSVYETSNSYYLVFELLTGGNIHEYVTTKGLFAEREAAALIKSILAGVKYLHDRNIMHRDIKPDNILFKSMNFFDANQIILADFGLATSNDAMEYLHPKCGTPGFCAPEIFGISSPTDHYSLKCDLFSLGVTLYYMLTGTLPYSGSRSLLQENRESAFDLCICKNFQSLSNPGILHRQICFQ